MKVAAAVLVAGILAPGVACAIDQGLGGHVGVNVGYSFAGNSDSDGSAAINGGYWHPLDGPVVSNAARQNLAPKGVDFGGEAGVHYRVGDLVPGLDVGFGAHRLRDSASLHTPYPTNVNGFDVHSSVETDWLLTIRPKLGFVVDDFMFDVSAGLAMTRVKIAQSFHDVNNMTQHAEASDLKLGWVIGGAVHYNITDHWAVKLDYMYTQFGRVDTTGHLYSPTGVQNASTISQSYNLSSHTLRAGILYNF